MRAYIYASILFNFNDVQACELLLVDPSGNAVTVFDQLAYLLDDCNIASSDDKLVQSFLPVVDLILPGHGYYRSRTTLGAINTIFRVPDFALEINEDILNPIRSIAATLYGSWTWTFTRINNILSNAVKIYHYSEVHKNLLDDEDTVMEFGNKQIVSSVFGDGIINTDIFNPSSYLPFAQVLPLMDLTVELSIYSAVATIFESLLNRNWSLLKGQFVYLGNLLTCFKLDILITMYQEQHMVSHFI